MERIGGLPTKGTSLAEHGKGGKNMTVEDLIEDFLQAHFDDLAMEVVLWEIYQDQHKN